MNTLLADFPVAYTPFSHLEKLFLRFKEPTFQHSSERKKFTLVNQTLLECIQNSAEPCFLLASVLDFISRVHEAALLQDPYRMLQFEFWLNHFSGLSQEENTRIRMKIVGKNIPRDEYQSFFPIGMGKTYTGSHFVAAHLAPDVDTTIASFWGWVDAFGARVTSGLHQWSLPGKLADSHTVRLFQEIFSKNVFELLVRPTETLTMTALDLINTKKLIKVDTKSRYEQIEINKPVIAIDQAGHFQGDWRTADAEAVRQVVVVFYSCISWLENELHERIISVFAKNSVLKSDLETALTSLLESVISESVAVKECSAHQKKNLHDFLKKVLGISKGTKASYSELIRELDTLLHLQFSPLQMLFDPELYDANERLIEDRPKIFSHLEKIFKELDVMQQTVRNYVDRLDLLIAIKEKVLGIPTPFITPKSDVSEIRKKMDNFDHLPVLVQEKGHVNKWFPIGVVYANDIKRELLGSVSLRDFSNELETKMASYLQVISIIDHHKSSITTSGVSTLIISDAQSANTLVAELEMEINDRYSLLGLSKESIDKELEIALQDYTSDKSIRRAQRVLQQKLNSSEKKEHYIHPKREFAEYLCFLHAILDDTDLLTKVSLRDVLCVQNLLNRMKIIASGHNAECISFDHIEQNSSFVENAARMVLQNKDMYSLYSKIYAFREKEVEKELAACVNNKPSSIFADTKEQNGCSRIGQTKLFSTNIAYFTQHVQTLQALWLETAQKTYTTKPQIDLHMQMITTIANADEVYTGKTGNWNHKDAIWFWIPETESATMRLVSFLNAFYSSQAVQNNDMQVTFYGNNSGRLEQIFTQNFAKATRKVVKEIDLPIAVLTYKAGLINSRKAAISPYLPQFIA